LGIRSTGKKQKKQTSSSSSVAFEAKLPEERHSDNKRRCAKEIWRLCQALPCSTALFTVDLRMVVQLLGCGK